MNKLKKKFKIVETLLSFFGILRAGAFGAGTESSAISGSFPSCTPGTDRRFGKLMGRRLRASKKEIINTKMRT